MVAPYSGAMLAIVARSASVSAVRPGPKNSTNLPTTPALRSIWVHGEHQVGGGRARRQLAAQPEADHLGDQHRERLAEHGRLGLDAADAPAQHAQPVDHGGVRIGADQRVREGEQLPPLACACVTTTRGQVLEVHLVHDAGVGRHHAEALEGLLPPAQEGVALPVARLLQFGVDARTHPRCRRRRLAPSGR